MLKVVGHDQIILYTVILYNIRHTGTTLEVIYTKSFIESFQGTACGSSYRIGSWLAFKPPENMI